jgi:putative SbcD/Mre11-related phosphoesterase
LAKLRILYPYPALIISEKKEKILVITDLHIGFEHRFNKEGLRIITSIDEMLDKTIKILTKYKPDELLILGDIKNGFGRIEKDERKHIPEYLEKVSNLIEVSIIPGNHDGGLQYLVPPNITLKPKELIVGDIGLLHGHTQPSNLFNRVKCIVIGHIHPSYNRNGIPLSGIPIWLKFRVLKKEVFANCNSKMLEILVMPSFNAELSCRGFTANRRKNISPLLRRIEGRIQDAVILTLDGSVIGDLNSIQYVM